MMKAIITSIAVPLCIAAHAQQALAADKPLFDMQQILDASTLKVETLQEWHVVEGAVATRQKLINIRVGELWPGQDYRVPVRLIVPANRRAKGFHLTGGHQLKEMQTDAQPKWIDKELIDGGVGLVYTIVQTLQSFGQAELGAAMQKRFTETLDPHYSNQYWGWPASLMRAATAAYAETGHFEVGKIALSGGSKNGASPSVSILNDKRMTALHASVSPIWASPLRLCDRGAWDELNTYNSSYLQKLNQGANAVDTKRMQNHPFLGGTFGPIYNAAALDSGHGWEDLQQLARRLADDIFISRNLEELETREVDLCFHPGTHDFVAYDIAWGGAEPSTDPGVPESQHRSRPEESASSSREG